MLQCLTTARHRQWLYLIGEEGVVYSQEQNRFAGLAAAGVSAYRAFDAGARPEDLQSFHDDPQTVDGEDTVSSPAVKSLHAIFALSQGDFPEDESDEERIAWPPLGHSETANIEIHGIPVRLEYPRGRYDELYRDCLRNAPATSRPARFHLRAQETNDGWAIYANGYEAFSSLQGEQLGLGVLHGLRSLLYAHAPYDVAFHAAMVAGDHRGILLSAPREAGKSTLAAHLIARGFDLVTDEPALLNLDTGLVSPLDMPVSLKEGSWSLFHHEWPHLDTAPVHRRSDSMRIKLLHPPPERKSRLPRRLTHIVFPRYSPSSSASVEAVSPVRALAFLNHGGMLLAAHLDKDMFEALLRLICQTPAFEVRYNSLRDAERLIQSVAT